MNTEIFYNQHPTDDGTPVDFLEILKKHRQEIAFIDLHYHPINALYEVLADPAFSGINMTLENRENTLILSTWFGEHSVRLETEKQTMNGNAQDDLIELSLRLLLVPPSMRAKFNATVGSLILHDHDTSSVLEFARTYVPTKRYLADSLQNVANPDIVQHFLPIYKAINILRSAHNITIEPSKLLDNPLLRLRYSLYSLFDTPEKIFADGAQGQLHIMLALFSGLIEQYKNTIPTHPLFTGDVKTQQTQSIALFHSDVFQQVLFNLTKTRNGILIPTILRQKHKTFTQYWNVQTDGTYSFSQDYIQEIKELMKQRNTKNGGHHQSIQHIESYQGYIEHIHGTTSGCPLGHSLQESPTYSTNPWDITYLPPNWKNELHKPYEMLNNPIDTYHEAVVILAKRLHNV